MSLAVVMSRALDGWDAPPVHVEVQLANGLPSFTLVGLADTEVKESRERVRAALQQSGLAFPHNKRITVNLAPAELPKDSGRFDLPIALGILAAAGQLDTARLAGLECAGELSLAGELRPVRGALALALALRRSGSGRALVLPPDSAQAAAQVSGVVVHVANNLAQVVAALVPGDAAEPLPRAQPAPRLEAAAGPDLRDVKGQAGAKRALEIAAAGGHSLLMVGPRARASRCWRSGCQACCPGSTTRAKTTPWSAPRCRAWGRPARRRACTARAPGAARTTPPARWPWWVVARRHVPVRFHWRTAGCFSSTRHRSSRAARWKPCASRWRPAWSALPAPHGGPAFRRVSSWWPP